jgi:hypothetical protein
MSTVLWANQLKDGTVETDAADKYVLFRYLDKLDATCTQCGIPLISEICDYTDYRFNIEDRELPDSMESTDELMAREGVWMDGKDAVSLLEQLLSKIQSDQVRFGLFSNRHDEVVLELEESLVFARKAEEAGARFNFSVVM